MRRPAYVGVLGAIGCVSAQNLLQPAYYPPNCALGCSRLTTFFTETGGCKFTTSPNATLLQNAEPCPPTEAMCGAGYCHSCTSNPNGWRTEHAPITNLIVSGDCDKDASGIVTWQTPVFLSGTLSGKALVRGPCPLVLAQENAIIQNINFECVGGSAAVDVQGPGVKITGTARGGGLVRAVKVQGVDVSGLQVTGTVYGDYPLAVLGHSEGDYSINCLNLDEVVSQPLSGTGTYTGCSVVDVAQLLNVFGRHYEVEFNNKDAFDTSDGNLILSLFLVAVAGGIVLILAHQDVFQLYQLSKKKEK